MWKGSVVDDRARARFSIGFIGKIEETPLLLHVIYLTMSWARLEEVVECGQLNDKVPMLKLMA